MITHLKSDNYLSRPITHWELPHITLRARCNATYFPSIELMKNKFKLMCKNDS